MKNLISKNKNLTLTAALLLTIFSANSFANSSSVDECCAAWGKDSNGESFAVVVCAVTQSKACEIALAAVAQQ
jgi:hypothetical protein